MYQQYKPVRGIKNYNRWKRVKGLADDFPTLKFIQDDELFEKCLIHEDEETKINLKLLNPLTTVIMQKGHGTTTLCRYVLKKVQQQILKSAGGSRCIPIGVNMKEIWEDEDIYFDIEGTLRHGILYNLMIKPWEDALPTKDDFYDLIGAYEQDLGRPGTGHFRKFKDELRHLLEQKRKLTQKLSEDGYWDEVFKLCPAFDIDIIELLEKFEKFSTKPVLFFDISHQIKKEFSVNRKEPEDQILQMFYGHIKDFHQDNKPKAQLLSEIFFLTNDAWKTFDTLWPRTPAEIRYEPYSAVEVFEILDRHHAPPTYAKARLDGIMAGKFIRLAFSPRKKPKTLCELIEKLEQQIILSLDVPWDEVPAGKLTLTAKQNEELNQENTHSSDSGDYRGEQNETHE